MLTVPAAALYVNRVRAQGCLFGARTPPLLERADFSYIMSARQRSLTLTECPDTQSGQVKSPHRADRCSGN
jgi:hypothetical protein